MSDLKTMYSGQGNSPFTTTLGEISATDTAVVVADASALPATLPYLLTLGYDKSASETVLVTAVSGNTLTIVRAVDGPALLWVAGTKAARIFTAKDLNDIQENIRTLNDEKQENLTIDAAPTKDSGNPVSSGGVHSVLSAKANAASLASHTGNTANPHKVTAAQTGAATPVELAAAISDISCIGDLRTTIGTPSENWLPCDGRGVMEEDYPELVPLLGQNVKRWPVTGSRSERFFCVEGKLLLTANKSILEYLPDEGIWLEHTGVSDYTTISCITFYNGTWIAASTELVMYVYTSESLDGPWEKHGPYGNSSTLYPRIPIPKGDGGLLVAGYDFYSYQGVGILTADFQWSYTLYSKAEKFETKFFKYVNGFWIIGAMSYTDNKYPYILFSQDPTAPASSWTKVKLASTPYVASDIAYFDNTWVVSLGAYDNFSKYGIRLVCSKDLGSGWELKNIDTQPGTPYVRQMVVDNGILYAVGWRNGPFVLRVESLDNWTYCKLREAGNEYPSLITEDGGVFVYSYNSAADCCVARIQDVTRDLLWDAALPSITPEAGTTYIKAK